MPGIAGIIAAGSSRPNRGNLDSMLKCMMHEPFYVLGTFLSEQSGIAAGWVNHSGSFCDCLPIWNEKRDVCLLFVGETFPDENEVERLRLKGHAFEDGDASYLVHQYEELGDEFYASLNGTFAGLVLDFRLGRTVLFNDRYGIGRIYFHETEDGFYFSSEAKSLLKVLAGVRQLDLEGVGEFLSCGCVLRNRTLFSGISLLPAGSAWTFAVGRPVKKQTYFRAEEWEHQTPLNEAEFYETFKDTWRRVVPRYFRGRERIGLSLTGGVDSRMILAWMPGSAGIPASYTFNGRYRECADVRISRRVAEASGLSHQVISVGPEFLSRFPALAEKAVYVTDGAMDVTGAVDLYVQECARQIAPVRVTGTNGGEILRSLVNFKPSNLCEGLLDPELSRHARNASVTYDEEFRGRTLSFTTFKQSPWFMGAKFILERSLVTLRMPYFDNEFVALVYKAPASASANNGISRRLISDGSEALGRIGTDRGATPTTIPGYAWGQRQLREFTFKAEYAYDYGMPQWLAKFDYALAPFHLERLFLGRHKIHHFRIYYRDELAGYVRDVLLDARSLGRSYLRGESVAKVVEAHLEGRGNHTQEIHKLLTLELIQRRLIEDQN